MVESADENEVYVEDTQVIAEEEVINIQSANQVFRLRKPKS